jgi:hypothetical protein
VRYLQCCSHPHQVRMLHGTCAEPVRMRHVCPSRGTPPLSLVCPKCDIDCIVNIYCSTKVICLSICVCEFRIQKQNCVLGWTRTIDLPDPERKSAHDWTRTLDTWLVTKLVTRQIVQIVQSVLHSSSLVTCRLCSFSPIRYAYIVPLSTI